MKQAELFSIFTEKQIEAIKLIINEGFWGDIDMSFTDNPKEQSYAYGYSTNIGKNKQFSGILSGISKTIKTNKLEFIKMCPDWWQDGSGDMMFLNMEMLDETSLENWVKN